MSSEQPANTPEDGKSSIDYNALFESDHPNAITDKTQAHVEANASNAAHTEAVIAEKMADTVSQQVAAINTELPPAFQDEATAQEVADKQQFAADMKAVSAGLSEQADAEAKSAGDEYKLTQMDHEFTRVDNSPQAVLNAKREDLGRDFVKLGEEQIYAGQSRQGEENINQGKDFLRAQAEGKLSDEPAARGNEVAVDAARAAIQRSLAEVSENDNQPN